MDIKSFLGGLITANYQQELQEKDNELTAGHSHIPAAFCKISLIFTQSEIISNIYSDYKKGAGLGKFSLASKIFKIISIPAAILAAMAKEMDLVESLAKKANFDEAKLNKLLKYSGVNLLSKSAAFFFDNLGSIVRVATVVEVVAMVALGHTAVAAAFLLMTGFNTLARFKFVPTCISEFNEEYSPYISNIYFVLCGDILTKILNLAALAVSLVNFIPKFHLNLLDKLFFYRSRSKGHTDMPTLAEVSAPLKVEKLSESDVVKIFEFANSSKSKALSSHFSLNYAYLSNIESFQNLPEDENYDKFLELYSKWKKSFTTDEKFLNVIKPRLADSEKFLDHLAKDCGIKLDYFKIFAKVSEKQTEVNKQILAACEKKSISEMEYVNGYLDNSFKAAVGRLNGEKGDGSYADMTRARENFAKILYQCQKSIETNNNFFAIESILTTMAVDLGHYCNLAYFDESTTLLALLVKSENGLDPEQIFCANLSMLITNISNSTSEEIFKSILESFSGVEAIKKLSNDRHSIGMLTESLKFGLSKLEPKNNTFINLYYRWYLLDNWNEVKEDIRNQLLNFDDQAMLFDWTSKETIPEKIFNIIKKTFDEETAELVLDYYTSGKVEFTNSKGVKTTLSTKPDETRYLVTLLILLNWNVLKFQP